MKSRRNRSFVRSLHSRAGRAGSIRESHFEALEERKLLFSLTITPDMDFDGDGLGTATATFGYTLPYLDNIPDVSDADVENIDENFNDETPGSIPNRFTFLESDIRVSHGFGLSQNFRIDPNDPDDTERYIRVNAVNGSFMTFEPLVLPDDPNAPGAQIFNRTATQVTFTISDPDNAGMLPNDFIVDLLFFDEVIDSFTADELIAANQSGSSLDRQRGIGTFRFDASTATMQAFTGFRIRSTTSEDFRLDDLSFTVPTGQFADIVESRVFGADVSFTAPIGASVQVLDLYGRDMQRTIALGRPEQLDLTLVDLDDDGVPNFNDGLGKVVFSGVDSRASFTMFGGTITYDTGFVYTRTENFVGLYDEFEDTAGFGYHVEYDNGEPTLYGLPGGPGSVVFGSPYVRDNTNAGTYRPTALPQGFGVVVQTGFSRPDQGVFVPDGQSMGSVYIHGVMHGSSQFSGAVNELYFGTLLGSVTVEGDLGTMYVGSDAGFWISDDDAQNVQRVDVGAQLSVGRTAGEVAIAGRSDLNIAVGGDLSNAQQRPPHDPFRFAEREKTYAFTDSDNPEATIMASISIPTADIFGDFGLFTDPGGRSPIFGATTLRNDTIMGAEFVGSIASAVQVSGTIGFGDPINGDEDPIDVFAFAVDGRGPVSLQFNTQTNMGLVRIMDQNGRTLAATEFERGTFNAQEITFTPATAGVYYAVVSDIGVGLVDTDMGTGWSYIVTLSGLAPTVLGSYRTGGSSGHLRGNVVNTLAGDIGMLRIGTGYTQNGAAETDPTELLNDAEELEDNMDLIRGSFSAPGNLYAMIVGSDIRTVELFVGGDMGTLAVGMSPIVGGAAGDGAQGDIAGFVLTVGGRIADMDIKGSVGVDQDEDDLPFFVRTFDIRTGVAGGDGSIGRIRIGSDVAGGNLLIQTSPGSVVGQLLVSQDKPDGRGIYDGDFTNSDIQLGFGSDIRFVDFPHIDLLNTPDHDIELIGGQAVEFVDDGGGVVTIQVQGVFDNSVVGHVRFLPVDNSQGVAIARIDGVDLTGGRTLRITSTGRLGGGSAPISIGLIEVVGADALSGVQVTGNVEIDVWRIVQNGGDTLNNIRNLTPNGDLVAVDVASVGEVQLGTGDLGRTQVPSFGPQLIGPFLGVAIGEQGDVGGALGVDDGALSWQDLAGPVRPVSDITGVYLDDIGMPFDGYLNGLVVRTGSVQSVRAGGAIGDVILQGGGEIVDVLADNDMLQVEGRFEGIVGNIYAGDINRVDVGEGLADSARAPALLTGIFATDEIRNIVVNGLLHPGAFLSSVVIASNISTDNRPNGDTEVGGVGAITASSADLRDVYIGAMSLDDFRTSFAIFEGGVFRGTIGSITGLGSDIFRSNIEALFVSNISLTGGAFDASIINAGRDALNLDFGVVRNSTLSGSTQEFHDNSITVSRNLRTFLATSVADLTLQVAGSVLDSISADSFARVALGVNNTLPELAITENVVASEINAGRITSIEIGGALRTSTVGASGPLDAITVGTEIFNSEISVTGPQGELGEVTAVTRITGSISASGPIGTISTTTGDIIARIVTTTDRGTVDEINAGRDLILDTNISESVGLLQAGRHIGAPAAEGVIFINGALPSVVAGGHLFSDIRVGKTLDAVTIGATVNRPGAPSALSGSLVAAEGVGVVTIEGDYGGEILAFSGGIASVVINNGSLLATGRIAAFDSDLVSVVINGGNLYGDIHSSRDINSVVINPSADGVFGDLGVNPAFSAGTAYDSFRGQLPPGTLPTAAKDGPVISADRNIDSIVVAGGSVFESTIFAGRLLSSVDITGSVASDTTPQNTGRTVFAAGDAITRINITGSVNLAQVLAGVRSLGDDRNAGGFGDDADTTQAGSISGLTVGGNFTNSQIAAGMEPGPDRQYNTADDKLEIGSSSVGGISIGGSATGSSVYTDTFLPGGTAGGKLAWGGAFRTVDNSDIATATAGTQLTAGTSFAFSTSAGTGTIRFTGPGRAFFDAATNRVILDRTTAASTLLVHADGDQTLTDFDIVSTEGASMGVIRVEAARSGGDSDIVLDENVTSLQVGSRAGTGTIQAGTNIGSFSSGRFAGGTLTARHAGSVVVHADFGDSDPDVRAEATMSFVTADSISFLGAMRGAVSARYSIGGVAIAGALDNGLIRAGEALGALTAASITESRISSGDTLAGLTVGGDVFDTSVMIGGDLGDDAEVGGAGFNADTVSAGFIGAVSIGGDFTISDIVAGYLRGPDGFFGTNDDRLSSGRSAIDSVTIGGEASGSNRSTESYRIASTGTLGAVTEGGAPAQNDGNFVIEAVPVAPLPIQVVTLDIRQSGRLFAGEILFNQPIDISSLTTALSVSEVRGAGDVEIRLIQGHDYIIEAGEDPNAVLVRFDASVTERNLPQLSDQPGPGVYRFEVLTSLVRAAGALAELDGDGDGRVSGGENFSQDTIIGDAGDKLNSQSVDFAGGNGFPATHIDFYSPVNLDVLLDDNLHMDGLPDANTEFTIRGTIGDHPDNTSNYFSFASDTDIFSLTLQAGQILRLGGIQGAAFRAGRLLVQPDGEILSFGSTDFGLQLPFDPGDLENLTPNPDENYLIRRTGTYHIVLTNAGAFDNNSVPNVDPVPGGVGEYWFSIEVFDDGDSGFSAPTTSGDGQNLVNAPRPGAFAGDDGTLGTADDLTSITQGAYRFTYSPGADGIHATADDIVSGSNGSNVSSATNGLGVGIISVDAAIGNAGSAGVPTDFAPDVDIFHLNAGNIIATGTVIKVTLKLSDLGSDLGSRFDGTNRSVSLANYAQFGIFDTTTSTGSDDALLLFSPTDVSPFGGGEPGVIADNGNVAYGYDDNGDFYIEFAAPGRMDLPGADASYAIYVQGVTNSDYRVEVVTGGSREIVRRRQNILLETGGGSVDWLEVGGVSTPFGPFVASSLGFTGNASNGQAIDDFLIDRIGEIMQGVFDGVVVGAGSDGVFGTADDLTGLDITVSSDPNDFEFQDFSTVFLTSTLDPIEPIFAQDGLFAQSRGTVLFSTQPFGVSQHADAGNADRNDEAVLFIPAFTSLGYTPSSEDVENFAQSLAAAATRRAGELMGLRLTENYDPTLDLFDVMAANSVASVPGDTGTYELSFLDRRLSSDEDSAVGSDFFLGFQNAAGVLSLYTRS